MADGLQINLDNGEGRILSGSYTDDIFSCCAFLEIIFECSDKLVFGADNNYYLTYSGQNWVPIQLNESTGSNNTWHYDLGCIPAPMMTLITKPCHNTQELARALKCNLTDLSSSLKLPCSTIHQFAANMIQDNRLYSLEQAYGKEMLGDAVYIYGNSKNLYTATWRTILNQSATVLDTSSFLAGSDKFTYQDYQFDSVLKTAHNPIPWKQKDYIEKMIGPQFKVETAVPAFFLNVYTMKFDNIEGFDTGLPFLCTYTKRDIMDANSYVHCFSSIKYVE